MPERSENLNQSLLVALPDDVLYEVFSYCDRQSLGRLASTCKRLRLLCCQDCVWLRLRKSITVVSNARHGSRYYAVNSAKEECHLSHNWTNGKYSEYRLITHKVKQLPWLLLDEENVWISHQNIIKCYKKKSNGRLHELPDKTLLGGHNGDITRFKSKGGLLVSGSRDGTICGYNILAGQMFIHLKNCHSSDIHDVDFHNDIIVSGSRDGSVKLWSMDSAENNALKYHIPIQDRVWSVAFNPRGNSFITGTAGVNNISPLRLWDTETGQPLSILGSDYKHGAGMLDLHFESPDVLFSCGYDTYIRLWDLRAPHSQCVSQWEDQFDSTVYTVKSDGRDCFISGTSRHGLVRLWDKRSIKHIQMYYIGRQSSPVYSLDFDSQYLYVALDRGIYLLDFTV